MPQGPFLKKYGVETKINFVLFEIDGVNFRTDAVHASGDSKIMKDEGDEGNTTNGFVDEGQDYSITLTNTEMEAARIVVYLVDSATKVWLDDSLVIETYGNASAMHAFDLDTATVNLSSATETQIDNIEGDTEELQTDDVPGAIAALNDPTAAAIADQVWDEATADHQAAGSTGKALIDAQAAGDPWASALPGAYGVGTAGSIIGNLIASMWSNVTRTLTQTAAEIQAVLEGSRITIHRGDDLSVSLTGLGSLASRTHLWFTVKRDKSDIDTAAIIQITEGEGLKRLNGAEGTAGNGSLTVDDEDAGNITLVLKAVETAKLRRANLHYDVQVLIGGVISTRTESRCNIAMDVTRATSG